MNSDYLHAYKTRTHTHTRARAYINAHIPGRVKENIFKMVLDISLLNTQHYKVRITGKEEQSRERSSALPYTSVL